MAGLGVAVDVADLPQFDLAELLGERAARDPQIRGLRASDAA
jgi:hypothetical protein